MKVHLAKFNVQTLIQNTKHKYHAVGIFRSTLEEWNMLPSHIKLRKLLNAQIISIQ